MRISLMVVAGLIMLLASPSPSFAGMVRLSVTGEVDLPSASQPPFNLASGDTVRLIAIFDEELRPEGAAQTLVFNQSGNATDGSLRFEIGDRTFTEDDDVAFDTGSNPSVLFDSDGNISSIDTRVRNASGVDIFNSSNLAFDGENGLFGEWDPASTTITAVGLPASIGLIAPALFAVWFLHWRERRLTLPGRRHVHAQCLAEPCSA